MHILGVSCGNIEFLEKRVLPTTFWIFNIFLTDAVPYIPFHLTKKKKFFFERAFSKQVQIFLALKVQCKIYRKYRNIKFGIILS